MDRADDAIGSEQRDKPPDLPPVAEVPGIAESAAVPRAIFRDARRICPELGQKLGRGSGYPGIGVGQGHGRAFTGGMRTPLAASGEELPPGKGLRRG